MVAVQMRQYYGVYIKRVYIFAKFQQGAAAHINNNVFASALQQIATGSVPARGVFSVTAYYRKRHGFFRFCHNLPFVFTLPFLFALPPD
jgi:hypothetical protein